MATNSFLRITAIAIWLAVISASITGCTYGLLYTSSTSPYVLNFDKTPAGICSPSNGARLVSLPTTVLSAGWNSRAIGEAAKQAGLTEIYYADLHTFSLLAGLWEEKSLRVCGRE